MHAIDASTSYRYLPVFEIHSFRGIVSSEDILEEAVNNRMEIFDSVG
jgi:hypothetical protein